MPIAPTTNLDEIKYFSSSKNPITRQYQSGIKSIFKATNQKTRGILITKNSTEISMDVKNLLKSLVALQKFLRLPPPRKSGKTIDLAR